MVTQIRNLDFLPEIFRTKPNEQFLSQTLDVLTSKPDLTRVEGFIGENYGIAVAPTDRYVVEPTSERQNYQLTPAVTFLKNSTQTAKDFIDYPNIIRALGNQGALTDNHDRLFSNEFYAWDSFIDLDKFVNYGQYFWLPLGPDAIEITDAINVTTSIIGQTQFTSAAGVKFVNGLKVKFTDPSIAAQYLDQEFYVEGVGDSIQLVPVEELKVIEPTGGSIYLPWQPGSNIEIITDDINVAVDIIGQAQYTSPSGVQFVDGMGIIFTNPLVPLTYLNKSFYVSGVGTSIQLTPASGNGWSNFVIGWDARTQIATNIEYLLISRNSRDRNAWSRTNRWFSQEVLDITTQFNGQSTTNTANSPSRASRPIIEYYGNLSLFNSGTESLGIVDYVDTTPVDPTLTSPLINGGTISLLDGATVIFINAPTASIREKVYVVVYSYDASGNVTGVTLTPTWTAVENNLVGVAYGPSGYEGVSLLSSLNTAGEIVWSVAQTKKTINQYPLFDIFDRNDVSYSDQTVYPNSTFAGNKLFSYTTGTGVNDSVLGFPISYSKLTNLGDINFTINLNTDSFEYGESSNGITKSVSTGLVHQSLTIGTFIRKTGWVKAAADSVQYQVFNFIIDDDVTTESVECDILIDTSSVWQGIKVYLNGEIMPNTDYITVSDTELNTTTVIFNTSLSVGDGITVLLNSKQVSKVAYYQVPTNLQNNPFNTNMSMLTAGDIRRHYSTIFTNAPGVTGQQFGTNNISNLGDLTSYGTSIIQSSAPLVLPGIFLRKPDYNLIDALRFNSIEYEKYKALIIDTAYNGDYSVYQTPAQVLDHVIYRITDAKSADGSFFWSDMLPFGSPANTIKTTIALPVATITTVLSITHDYANANYNGLCVYVNRIVNSRNMSTQLVKGRDYVVTGNSLTVNYLFLAADVLVINEYNQTYGSYVPNTPTKLGMYQATIPTVVVDNTYTQPISFIVGHDGSYTKLYGNYIAGLFDDFRDMALFEFETRVYNNLKVDASLPLSYTDIFPGQSRTTDYTRNELLTAYAENFLAWVGRNRVDYRTQVYNSLNQFTYNYNKSSNRLTGAVMEQGYWRGIYRWLYDTTNPADAPWEMLGLTTKPTWWDVQYGPAPYLSTNALMWGDIADGRIWNNGAPYIEVSRVRPRLLEVLPVDDTGALVSPFISIIGNYTRLTFERSWVVGDEGPTESAYLRSSTWPFDQMALLSISKPAKFYNFYADRDNYKYDSVLDQYLYNGRTHIDPRNLEIYGGGTAKHSYINWVVDYINQWGTDGKTDVDNTLANLDVRLAYRIAGFSDKQYLRFFIERSTPTSTTPRLLIPDASYDVLLHDNPPEDKVTYSSVIIQKTDQGYTVWGNSTTLPFFRVATPEAGPVEKITVGTETINVGTAFSSTRTTPVAYGTLFYSLQGVCEFMRSYGIYLENSGVIFDNILDGSAVGWTQMIREFINWAQQDWEVGSTLSLNPSATNFGIMREGLVVQPLTMGHDNFILNQNQIPLQQESYKIDRNNEEFRINVLSVGDAIAYTNLHLNSIEHAVIFNNITEFNDVIYDLEAGLRQNRVVMTGKKTAGWSGYVKANGFILNEGDIALWNKNTKYNKGQIVEFKNAYYSAQELVQPGSEFDYSKWVLNNYAQVKVGLLPNPTTRAYEASKFYDITDANLAQDEDLLAFGLIGFRPRQYMTDAELTDISQVNLYINMIRNKGTITSANAFKNANMTQGPIDYDIRENWAIKNGEFGSTGNNQFVEFELSSDTLTGNPAIISFSTTGKVTGAQQTVSISNLINYYNKPTTANILPSYSTQYSIERGLPTAGYVNKDDVKITAYDFDGLNLNLDDLSTLYVGDYVWIANYQSSWAVFTPQSVSTTITTVTNNLNGTVNVTFASAHGLLKKDPIAIIDFDAAINGYYIVSDVVNLQTITVVSSLSRTVNQLSGIGIVLKLIDVRAKQASDLITRTITGATKFNTRLSWADNNTENDWRVLATEEVYKATSSIDGYQSEYNANTLGTRVAHSNLIGDLSTVSSGEVYRNGIIVTDNLGVPIKAEFGMKVVGNTLYCATMGLGMALVNRWDIGAWNYGPTTTGNLSPGVGWTGIPAGTMYPLIKVYDFLGGVFSLVDIIDPGLGVTSIPPLVEVTDFAVSEDKEWVYISNSPVGQIHSFKLNHSTKKYAYMSTINAILGMGAGFTVSVITPNWDIGGWSAGSYEVTMFSSGRNFNIGDFIKVSGVELVGVDGKNDLIIDITSVNDRGEIIAFIISGTPADNFIPTTFTNRYSDVNYADDGWGYAIDTNYDGTKVVVGAPRKGIMGIPSAGFSEIYNRANERFIQNGVSPVFVTQSPIPSLQQTYYDIVPSNTLNTNTNVIGVGTGTTLAVYYEVGSTNLLVTATAEGVGYTLGDWLRINGGSIGALGDGTNDIVVEVTMVDAVGAVLNVAVAMPPLSPFKTTTGNPEILINGVETTTYTLLSDADETVITFASPPSIGDEVTVNYGTLTLQQRTQRLELSGGEYVAQPENSALYGHSVATNKYGAEIMVGCPYGITVLLTNEQTEGSVYRWTNTGQRYGQITARISSLVVNETILINGYRVDLAVSELTTEMAAIEIANQINIQEPTNVSAVASGNQVLITVRTTDSSPGDILDIVGTAPNFTRFGQVWVNDSLVALGIQPYTNTQVITSPDLGTNTAFGWSIALNKGESLGDSLVVGSASTNGLINSTFDFSNNLRDDDTIFDHGATTFIDSVTRSGSGYMFDYLQSSSETYDNPGNYVFGQYCFGIDRYYDDTLLAGDATSRNGENIAVSFNDGSVLIGTPYWYPTVSNPPADYPNGRGRVVKYITNDNTKPSSWYIYRQPLQRVDVNKLNSAIIYSTVTNENIDFLDHIDPIQGKMLSVVETNIDIKSVVDPAVYSGGLVWGSNQVGTTWLDTSNIRLLNYHQTDIEYNAENWGKLFPGSTADIYVWVASAQAPLSYTGRGYIVDFESYTTSLVLDRTSNSIVTMYHFWVKGYDLIPEGKTLSPTVLSQYIIDPQSSGISYLAAITTDTIALYNSNDGIQVNGSALHLGFSTGTVGDNAHTDWTLIQDGERTDFLNGVPAAVVSDPTSLYLKYLNSFMGYQLDGLTVPDKNLPALLRHGVSFRPRQTMFVDRKAALKNYIDYANSILIQYPITETRDTYHLTQSARATVVGAPTEDIILDSTLGMAVDQPFKFTGTLFGGLTNATYYITSITGNVITVTTKIGEPSTVVTANGSTECNLWYPMNYVTEVDWWATGYNSSTKAMFEMPTYTDLMTVGNRELYSSDEPLFLTLYDGLIAKVKNNGKGKSETYVWKATTGWVRIGLKRGTYQISEMIYGDPPVNSVLKFGWEKYGWNNVGWDRNTVVSIVTPANEIYRIIRWLTEQVYTYDLQIENNRSLMLMFAVIQSQSNQQNNFLPWLNKTSLVDVSHTVRELKPFKRYQFDNEGLVSGYLNEVKPYHVYIKNYIYKYSVPENLGVKTMDFDLPSKFNKATGLFSTPRLVTVATGIPGDYLASDPIWTDPDYIDWFNNRTGSPIRKINTTIKFDRTSVRPSATSWDKHIYKWSPSMNNTGWGAQPWSQVSYLVGDQVIYNGSIYRCVIANGDDVFNAVKWLRVPSGDVGINAIDRIVSYYTPTVNGSGFTQTDYDRLISNMSYMKITRYNPAYTLGTTIDWSASSANSITVGASIISRVNQSYTANPASDPPNFIFGSAVTYIAGITNGITNVGSPLSNGNSYWVNSISATEIALYSTKLAAIGNAAADRIVLTGTLTNDQFVFGQYPFATIADDIVNNPYWQIDGVPSTTLSPDYEPEEFVGGVMTDSVLVSVSGTSVAGSLSPVQNVIIEIDTMNMEWKNIDLSISPLSEAVVPTYSADQILSANLPSTGVYYNGTKLEYLTDYTIEYRDESSSKMILNAKYSNQSINFAFYVVPKVTVIGVTRAQYFDDSWF